MRVWEVYQSGGPVMWPLLACSVLALAVILERFMFWVGFFKNRERSLAGEVLDLASRGEWDVIRERTAGSRDCVIRVLVSGILHRDYDMASAMEAEARSQIQKMRKFMGVLDTMITVSPLLGIFGTVLGIIASFKVLGMAGLDDPRAVTGGIAQALITTAAGLGIAIMSVFPYNYYNSRIERAIHEMEKYATSLELAYEHFLRARDKGE
ncbi:MAG: MotA/TolQ/ExbB proton channel family protein [Desulfobulbaceae bacterium]|nr:MotA/TolQ/ExbB proton channel family protein [Desulfobulbaceae bacterium]